jgi:hypothetical protein
VEQSEMGLIALEKFVYCQYTKLAQVVFCHSSEGGLKMNSVDFKVT